MHLEYVRLKQVQLCKFLGSQLKGGVRHRCTEAYTSRERCISLTNQSIKVYENIGRHTGKSPKLLISKHFYR